MKVAEYIASFVAAKTKVFWGYIGGFNADILEKYCDLEESNFVLNYHEQAAAFAANAYSIIKEKPAFATASGAPSACNLIAGIAIQEAQVLGCAIAASDCSGNREQIVSGVDGLLCPFSPEGIANAVEYLIEHPQTAQSFGRAAAQKACHFENDIHMIRDLLYSP